MAERLFKVGKDWLTESQIPQIFNLSNVFSDFKKTYEQFGFEEARKLFIPLLRKQLESLIQEIVEQPLTQSYLYKVQTAETKKLSVIDPDYPQDPDIVNRANPFKWYKLSENDGVEQLYKVSPLAKSFIDRFLLEFEQIRLFIEDILPNDPLLSRAFIEQLASSTQPMRIPLQDGNTLEGYVSNWYAMAMPATKVHKGNSSYFNMYRLVAVPNADGTHNYFVQKQGYLHKLSWKKQIHELMNLDQLPSLVLPANASFKERITLIIHHYFPQLRPDFFSTRDEQEFMMRIIILDQRRNLPDPTAVLVQIGTEAGDIRLPERILKARERQKAQTEQIENSIEAILNIFKRELSMHSGTAQDNRLKAFFEAIGNPLYFNEAVPTQAIVESFDNTLARGLGRDAYISSLQLSIPTIVKQAAGWFPCNMLSAGGLLKDSINPVRTANGFGGLDIDHCLTCPACGKSGITGNSCSCGFARGMKLEEFQVNQNQISRSKVLSQSLNSVKYESNKSSSFSLTPTTSISPTQIFLRSNNSVSVSETLANLIA